MAVQPCMGWIPIKTKSKKQKTSVLVTASTCEDATSINGITLQSAFHLPVKSGFESYEYKNPSDETVHMLRSK